MSGQADSAPTSIDDVAAFLSENEGADSALEDRSNPQHASEPGTPDNSDAHEDPDADPGADPGEELDADADDADGDSEDEAQSQTSPLIEVLVKGADGAEVAEKVTLDELKASYLRHSDYTRKTMELGERERQAFDTLETRLAEGRQHYLQEAQKSHRAIVMLAGLKSDEEMAALAHTDPSAWVAENARAQAIKGLLQQIEQGMQHEQQAGTQKAQEAQRAEYSRAWGVLGQHGIDKPALMEIFKSTHEAYGVPMEKFARVLDPNLVLIMRDAKEYRALKSKAAGLKKTVEKAPPLPAARQPVPQQTRVNKQLGQRFASGKASTRDLGRWLELNG